MAHDIQDVFSDRDEVMRAVGEGDLEAVKAYLDGGFPADYKYDSGWTLLGRALTKDRYDIARLLIERGADLMDVGEGRCVYGHEGFTRYYKKSHGKETALLEYLYARYSDVDCGKTGRQRPIYDAIVKDNMDYVEFLRSKGAELPVGSENGELLSEVWSVGMLQLLLDNGHGEALKPGRWTNILDANLQRLNSMQQGWGWCGSSLKKALMGKMQYIVEQHPDKNYNPLGRLVDGRDSSRCRDRVELAEFFHLHGADLAYRYPDGDTLMHRAVKHRNLVMVKYLASKDAPLDEPDAAGMTPLQRARQADLTIYDALKAALAARTQPEAVVTAPDSQVDRPGGVPAALATHDLGSYHALLIAVQGYRHFPRLRTAANDVGDLGALLESRYGFTVRTLVDPGRRDILGELNRLRRTMTDTDNLLIYFAGHGLLDSATSQGYWIPVDGETDNNANWVSNADVRTAVTAIRAKHVLVVADSCFSGSILRSVQVRLDGRPPAMALAGKRARMVMTSGGMEPVMDRSAGDPRHSAFAGALLSVLGENSELLDGTSLFREVRERVSYNAAQVPEYSAMQNAGHEGGDFIFSPGK